MDFFQVATSAIQEMTLANWLSILVPAASAIFAIKTYRRSIKTSYAKERYEKVIAPIFLILEPHLNQKFDKNHLAKRLWRQWLYFCGKHYPDDRTKSWEAKQVSKIISDNHKIAGGHLVDFLYKNKHGQLRNRDMDQLCKYINKEYDRLCKQLGIPLRTISYSFRRYRFRFTLKQGIKFIIAAIVWIFLLTLVLAVIITFLEMSVRSLPDWLKTLVYVLYGLVVSLSFLNRY